MCLLRCGAWASTTPPSKSMVRKFRSWTAAPLPFVAAIDQAGIVTQSAVRRFIQVLKPVQVAIGDRFGELRPYAGGFRAEVEIDFANPRDRPSELYARSQPGELPPRDLPRPHLRLHERRGAALERRFRARRLVREFRGVRRRRVCSTPRACATADECARHKVLDVVGDLALAGLPLLGAYRSVRGGHKLNHAVLTALAGRSQRLAGGRRRRPPAARAAAPKSAAEWSAA